VKVLTLSVTAAGAGIARRLPYEHRQGPLVASVRDAWGSVDGFVLVCSTAIAVRAVAPLLAGKAVDPAVVCVDDEGRHAVALVGGHRAGANRLAEEVAALIGAVPVLSSASELAGLPALDGLPGFRCSGDVAGVMRRWLDGEPPKLRVDPALARWPVPLAEGTGPASVLVTDRVVPARPGEVVLRPRSIVIGAGASTGADPEALQRLVFSCLQDAGIHPEAVGAVATLDRKAGEPALAALVARLGVPVIGFPAGDLAGQAVPHPSPAVAGAVGTPSVAEAAALLAAGPGAELVVPKSVSATRDSTVAAARRRRPEGHLAVVGLGPGSPAQRTAEAAAAVRHADVVIGYGPYVDLAADLLSPAQTVVRSPIGAETERARRALGMAAAGQRVALVCSGDPGVYALASLVCELAPEAGSPPVTVVPGVTAALAAAAILGAPLGHDHAAVSLSDLLTEWEVIARRLEAVASADLVVSLYNPRSARRPSRLGEALAVLRRHRPPLTPAAVVTDAGREGCRVVRGDLSSLDPSGVGMTSLVVVGSSRTRWVGERMVTPRGYPL
jgi:cobalt-precorrin 5A hydrolase/precorrin-3B C17-methyltransferase